MAHDPYGAAWMTPWPLPPAEAAPVGFRCGPDIVIAAEPCEVVQASGEAAWDALAHLSPGWWAGYLSYDLGRSVERIRARHPEEPDVADLLLARYEARARVGRDGGRLEGTPSARRRLAGLLDRAPTPRPLEPMGAPASSMDRDAYERGVRAVLHLIRDGTCYQVNLTRQLSWPGAPDPLALAAGVQRRNPAPREAVLVLPRPRAQPISVVSASPETFLTWDDQTVESRPIKGTHTDPARLSASAKDRAENVMIVDLARNDLGRSCEFGTVHVPALCELEAHPGLYHLVSTVRGDRCASVSTSQLIRRAFPPASVTGAPKPRVLQAIEDLEACRRGVYCGAVGWIDTAHDRGALAVAIRTFVVADDTTRLGTGAGIVADSNPRREWNETELKAARFAEVLGGFDRREAPGGGLRRRGPEGT